MSPSSATAHATSATAELREPGGLFDDDRAGGIYRTAAEMIYAKGFDATSMAEIADAVELTKPGLYYYVKGKKELLFRIMSFAMDLLEARVVAPARQLADPAERLGAIVREHARLLTHERGALAILIDEVGGLGPDERRAIVARKRAYFDLIRDTLEALAGEGRLRPVDTTVATFGLIGQVMWLSRWYDPHGRLDADAVVADVTAIATAGVLLPAADADAAATPRSPATARTATSASSGATP